MTIVNTNMLRHEKTPVDNILKALSWDDIPEEYRDDCRDIAVRAALALLHQFERAYERGQKLLFPELYTPVGVEIGFTMTQRYIAVGKSVLFRDAIDKIIVAFVNHDYLDVSLSNLHPGNLLYSLSERGLDFLQRAEDEQREILEDLFYPIIGTHLFYMQDYYPRLLAQINVRNIAPIALSVIPLHLSVTESKLRELVMRECGFVQGWYGLTQLEQQLFETSCAESVRGLLDAGYLRPKEHHDKIAYALTTEGKNLRYSFPHGVPAQALSDIFDDAPVSLLTVDQLKHHEKLLIRMGRVIMDAVLAKGENAKLPLADVDRAIAQDAEIQQLADEDSPEYLQGREHVYDVLLAHRYLEEGDEDEQEVFMVGSAYADALSSIEDGSIDELMRRAFLDPAAAEQIPHPHHMLFDILTLVRDNPDINFYDLFAKVEDTLDLPYLQARLAPHRSNTTPRVRNRYAVAVQVLKQEGYLQVHGGQSGRLSRKDPERYTLTQSAIELLDRFPNGIPETVAARIVPLQKQALRHKLPEDIAAALNTGRKPYEKREHSQDSYSYQNSRGHYGSGPRSGYGAPVQATPQNIAQAQGGSGISSAAYASAQSFTQPAPAYQAPAPVPSQTPGVEQSSDAPSDALSAVESARNAVQDAQRRYRDVFKRALLQPQLQAVTKDRFTDIAADLFSVRGYTAERADASQGVQVIAYPSGGQRDRAFYVRTQRSADGAVSVQDITNLYLSLEQLGGQLGAFITDGTFGDDAYDEYIRCSTKYPHILVDLIAGDELMNRLIAHRLGIRDGRVPGTIELDDAYFSGSDSAAS